MRQVLKFLSHPAWQGSGALCTAFAVILTGVTIYLIVQPSLPSIANSPQAHESPVVNP